MIRLLKRTTDALAVIGAVGVVGMMLHVTLDVVLRETLSVSIPATNEIVSRYEMVALGILALPWTIRRGQMIKAEFLAQHFSGRLARLNAIAGELLCLVTYAVLAWSTWEAAVREFYTGTFFISLQTKVIAWPAYFFLPMAFGLAFIVTLVSLGLLLSGRDPSLLADERPAA